MARSFCVLLLSAACAVAQTVEGSVVSSATGDGIAGVKVEIVQASDAAYTATTDSRGHFLVEDVKDGAYTARYSSPGYWPSRDPESTRRFQVTAGVDTVKLQARMMPLASISGRVVDGNGEGVPHARLELTDARSGQLLTSSTDGNGKFDWHHQLFPGTYTLSVAPPVGLKRPDPEAGSDRALGWARTYYPGAASRDAASKIVLQPGRELWDIELKLAAVPAHAVRGVVLNSDGKPAPKVAILIGEGLLRPQTLRAESKPDGAFEFPAVVDGEWCLSVSGTSDGAPLQDTRWFEMAGHEIEGLKLRLGPLLTIRGSVVMETSAGVPAPKPPQVYLAAHVSRNALALGPRMGLHSRSNADGSFTLENVSPGVYRIIADDPPRPYYLDTIRLGEAEPATGEVELYSGAAQITLVYKADGGTVRGTVENCASGGIRLVPQDTAMRRPGFLRSAQCDSSDRYEIDAVRPGDYYALAFAGDSWPWESAEPDHDGLLSQAGRVAVRVGETAWADLHAITRPAY